MRVERKMLISMQDNTYYLFLSDYYHLQLVDSQGTPDNVTPVIYMYPSGFCVSLPFEVFYRVKLCNRQPSTCRDTYLASSDDVYRSHLQMHTDDAY